MLGEEPFQGKPNESVAQWILSGKTMAIPENMPDSVQALVKKCWMFQPEDRPSWNKIQEVLSQITIESSLFQTQEHEVPIPMESYSQLLQSPSLDSN